jgi:NAD(P)H-hydrate repair Nnr-like enzyme with NAD(P)H-hydrate epimerase domain
VEPIATLLFEEVTAMDDTVFGAGTVTVVLPLTPLREAVTAVEPAATAVTVPAGFTVATAEFALVHVAVAVTLAVELSL